MENSKFSKRSLLVLSMAALLAVGGVAVAASSVKKAPSVDAGETTYTFTMDKDHLLASNVVKIGSTDYTMWLSNDKYTAGTTNFGTILSGGYLVSCNPLYGIKSITADLASGSMRANFSNEQANNWARRICINPVNFVAGVASTVAIEGAPDYFYFEFLSDTIVTSISIDYTCNAIAEPTQESGDYLDLGKEAEGLSSASDLSWMTSTTYKNGGSRAHRIVGKNYGSWWYSLLIQVATPFAVTTTGHLEVDAYAISGKAWVSFKLYSIVDSKWVQFDSVEHGCDFNSTGFSHQSAYEHPSAAGTVSLVRISVDEKNSTAPIDIVLDNLTWVEG
jgi:hypothetical protein